jgi:hypothetical protein
MDEWANEWSMVFNFEKCKIMHVGKSNAQHNYFMNNDGFNQQLNNRSLKETLVC